MTDETGLVARKSHGMAGFDRPGQNEASCRALKWIRRIEAKHGPSQEEGRLLSPAFRWLHCCSINCPYIVDFFLMTPEYIALWKLTNIYLDT
jgi:hypothetical protein